MSLPTCYGIAWSKPENGGQDLADKVRNKLEEATGQKFSKYKAIKYIRAPYSEGGKVPAFVGVAYYVIQVEVSPSLDGFLQLSIDQVTVSNPVTNLLGFIQAGSGDKLVPIHIHNHGQLLK